MQIIPQNNDDKRVKNGNLGLETYSSYTTPFGFEKVLAEKNAHLLPKREQLISSTTVLSFEDILRLKNTLSEKNQITQEEQEALMSLLEEGGKHNVAAMIEQMTQGVMGIQGITPEEYISLQQFLQEIGFSVDEITQITGKMNGKNISESLLEDIINKTKEYSKGLEENETIQNMIPVLRKIFTGQYGTKNPVEAMQEFKEIQKYITEAEAIIEEIRTTQAQKDGAIENLSATIMDELQSLLHQKESKEQAQAQASIRQPIATSAEELRFSKSASDGVLKEFIETTEKEKSEWRDSKENLSQEQNAKEFEQDHFLQNQSVKKQDNNSFSIRRIGSQRLEQNTHFSTIHKTEILQTVEQGFISIQNNKTAQITLQLNPQDLGKVELQLQYQDGRMQALLRPEQSEIYQLLKEQAPHIMQSLQEQGVKVDSITVVENKGEWLQYQSSRDDFSHTTEEHLQERAFSQEQERKGRIQHLLQQLNQAKIAKEPIQSRRLLEVVA